MRGLDGQGSHRPPWEGEIHAFCFCCRGRALTISAASAADLETLRPSIPDVPQTTRTIDWTGFEFGATGGGNLIQADGSKFFGRTEDFRGAHASIFAGYQQQLGNNVVLGIEGDITYTGDNEKTFNTFDLTNTYIGQEKISTDWSGSIRARVGYAFDRLQLYTTGGWVATRVVDKADTTVAVGTFHENFQGVTVGAGADYALTDNIFARAEYRYNAFFERQFGSLDEKLAQHVVNVGLGMKF
ncbi:outer membrane protein [Pleomorphomonas sp. PLEO]|uniref:outer membrane protein n=1 Tax=Pleomorphomonas sp. PLEO TaxID=3239306 RepID=UPI00351E1236